MTCGLQLHHANLQQLHLTHSQQTARSVERYTSCGSVHLQHIAPRLYTKRHVSICIGQTSSSATPSPPHPAQPAPNVNNQQSRGTHTQTTPTRSLLRLGLQIISETDPKESASRQSVACRVASCFSVLWYTCTTLCKVWLFVHVAQPW
jgi:hypothetical protein